MPRGPGGGVHYEVVVNNFEVPYHKGSVAEGEALRFTSPSDVGKIPKERWDRTVSTVLTPHWVDPWTPGHLERQDAALE